MKRKVINFNRENVSGYAEYISWGNEIFVLSFSFEENEDNALSLDELIEIHLGEGVNIHYVEGADVWNPIKD